MSKLVYYAHSLHLYNTEQEKRDAKTLEDLGFNGFYNPNDPEVQKEVKEWKDKYGENKTMEYFNSILDKCDAIAFRAHPDGKIPSGVAYEIKYMLEKGKPIIELPTLISNRILSLEDTREYLKLLGNR